MDSDFVTIEEAAAFLGVDCDVLEDFVSSNKTSGIIDFRRVGDVERYLLADLIKIQTSDRTFDGRKAIVRKLIAPLHYSRFYQTRRTFGMKVLSTFIFAVATGGTGGILAYHYKKADDERTDATVAQDLFDEIFGQINLDCGYNLGKWYDHGDVHRDDRAAFDSILSGRPSMAASDHRMRNSLPVSMPVKSEYVLIGGPVSTPIVRDVWQYETGRRSGPSLKRVNEPLLPLPYSFIFDDEDDRMKDMERFSWTFADGSGRFADSPNRPLLDGQRNRLLIPKPSSEFRPVRGEQLRVPYDNYLIITRIPNFLSEKFDERYPDLWGSLVSIQATHGIGTRAVGLLLTHKGKDPLLKMKDAISDARAFQAVFRVSKPEVDSNGIDNFKNIEYTCSAVLDDNIPLPNYTNLRNTILQTHGYSAYM